MFRIVTFLLFLVRNPSVDASAVILTDAMPVTRGTIQFALHVSRGFTVEWIGMETHTMTQNKPNLAKYVLEVVRASSGTTMTLSPATATPHPQSLKERVEELINI